MFKSMSRTWLEVERVQVERVQDITEEQALLEGIVATPDGGFRVHGRRVGVEHPTARAAFSALWEQIHGFGAWKRNEQVWAVSYKLTDKP